MPRAVESSWPEQQHDMCNIILDATEYNTFNHYANYESNNHGDEYTGGMIFNINAKQDKPDSITWWFDFNPGVVS